MVPFRTSFCPDHIVLKSLTKLREFFLHRTELSLRTAILTSFKSTSIFFEEVRLPEGNEREKSEQLVCEQAGALDDRGGEHGEEVAKGRE